jgi:outer membrane protein insertion porin family
MPDLVPDEGAKTVKLVYRIEEGAKYKIGRIEIAGNTKTKDKVIRREIRLNEGDTFNASSLKRSYERLNNLNYFETIEVNPKPRPEEKVVDLDVKVKEKDTGMLTVGGGYSSQDGIIGLVDITQTNLFGGGQYLKWKGELGGQMKNFELTYRDPWFFDTELKFGATLYKNEREYGNFDRKAKGLELTIGKEFWEYWGWSLSYNLEDATISNVREDASLAVKDQEGNYLTSAISPSIWRDTRDNYMDPMSGSRNVLSLSFAGLGGDTGYLKAIADTSWYFPLFEVTAFHVRGRVGYLTDLFDKKLPIYQKFYVGGIDTIRGLDYGHAGPLDINGEPIGGDRMAVLNLEYIFPIFSEIKLKGVVFSDMGRAWDKNESFLTDMRYTAGLGVRWFSPFGPVRVEYGFNLKKKEGESGGKFEFGFGSAF